jgi:hypothetical protein
MTLISVAKHSVFFYFLIYFSMLRWKRQCHPRRVISGPVCWTDPSVSFTAFLTAAGVLTVIIHFISTISYSIILKRVFSMDMVIKTLVSINEINIKLCLYSIKHHSITTYGGMEVYFHGNLTFALDGCEWSVSCSIPPPRKSSWHPFGRRVGETQSWFGCCGERNKSLISTENGTPIQRPSIR